MQPRQQAANVALLPQQTALLLLQSAGQPALAQQQLPAALRW